MPRIVAILSSLILVVDVLGGVSMRSSACSMTTATGVQAATVTAGVTVDVVLLERTADRMEFEIKVTNAGEKAVLIVSDPIRVDGDRGAYLSLNKNNPAQLELRFEIFGPPVYTIYAPKNRVTFLRLEPGAIHQEKILLEGPLNDTKPPWGEWQDTHPIDMKNIQQVTARVGVLPDDPAIHAALKNAHSPEGLETVKSGPLKGEPLFKIQSVISSKILNVHP